MCFICQGVLIIYASLNCLGNKKIMRLFLKKIKAYDLVEKVSMHISVLVAYWIKLVSTVDLGNTIYARPFLLKKKNESVLTNLIFYYFFMTGTRIS